MATLALLRRRSDLLGPEGALKPIGEGADAQRTADAPHEAAVGDHAARKAGPGNPSAKPR